MDMKQCFSFVRMSFCGRSGAGLVRAGVWRFVWHSIGNSMRHQDLVFLLVTHAHVVSDFKVRERSFVVSADNDRGIIGQLENVGLKSIAPKEPSRMNREAD
jgi:hypothetical protein